MKTRKFIAIITAVIMLLSVGTMNAFAVETYSSNVLTPQDVTAYEDILDRLNDEYGYSMYFSPEIFTRDSKFENPTKYSLSEFEASIRKEIEEDIAINLESQTAIAKLGTVKWESAPFEGKTYTIPANVSIYSSAVMNEAYESMEPYMTSSSEATTQDNTRSSDKTLSSVQPKIGPTGQVVFMLNTTISITSYWKYSSVSGFNYGFFEGATYPIYLPTAMSYSYADSRRTVAANFNNQIFAAYFIPWTTDSCWKSKVFGSH